MIKQAKIITESLTLRNEKITIWYKSHIRSFEKEKLATLFAHNSVILNDFNVILQYLDKISLIQIYEDNVIRLHFKFSHYETPTFLFLENLSYEFILALIGLAKMP